MNHFRRKSDYDALTGLLNRGNALKVLKEVCAQPVIARWLVIGDADALKAVNHERGYVEGDRLLVHYAATLTRSLPAGSLIARWGGDEFLITIDASYDPIAALEATHAALREGTRTMSFGLTRLTSDFDSSLNRADHALHRAIIGGGARTVLDDSVD